MSLSDQIKKEREITGKAVEEHPWIETLAKLLIFIPLTIFALPIVLYLAGSPRADREKREKKEAELRAEYARHGWKYPFD